MRFLLKKAQEMADVVVSQGNLKDELEMLDIELTKALISQKKGNGVVVCGDAGSGKTTLLKKFIERAEKRLNESNDDPASIVYMETPDNPLGKDLFVAMLEAAGTPYDTITELSKLKETHLKHEIRRLIKSKNIRVWVLDEFQHAAEKWGEKKARDNANFLKLLLNNFPVLIVFAGTDAVKRVAIKGQYDSRSKVIEKEAMHIDSATAYQEYLDYLATLQSFNDIDGIEWDSPEIALPLFYESRGDLRKITDTFQTALIHADKNNAKKLTKKHFQDSWTKRYFPQQGEDVLFKTNTFKQPLDKLLDALRIDYDVE